MTRIIFRFKAWPNFLAATLIGVSAFAAGEAFWKDAKYLKRIQDQKYIAVKASTDDSKQPEIMNVEGAAQVMAPLEFVFKKTQDFESLKKVSSNFEEVIYYPDKNRLFVHVSAMGYHTQMILEVHAVDEGTQKKLNWESVEGGFRGMKGSFIFENIDHVKTMMSMMANFEAEKLPLPRILRGFGLEVVMQKVASRMRESLEDEYKASLTPSKPAKNKK